MLKLKLDSRPIYNHKSIDYELIQSQDLNFILKNPLDDTYYDIFMYDDDYNVIAAYINLNSDYGEELVAYKPPQIPKNDRKRYRIDLYQSKTLSGQIVSEDRYDLREHIDRYDLKLVERITIYIDHDFNPYNDNDDVKVIKQVKPERKILKDGDLNQNQRKWCRCLLQVSSENPTLYVITQPWFLQTKSYQAPEKVCSGQKTSLEQCNRNYKFSELNLTELIGYLNLNQIYVPLPYDRRKLLLIIRNLLK